MRATRWLRFGRSNVLQQQQLHGQPVRAWKIQEGFPNMDIAKNPTGNGLCKDKDDHQRKLVNIDKNQTMPASAMEMDSRPKSIFRRELPIPPAIASFTSDRGQEIFQRALLNGTMKCYFGLAQHFRTQDEPAFCGISTLVMVLNAFQQDPFKIWKGSWRFYHEDMLNCCTSLEEVKKTGITLSSWMCLAECNGARIVRHGSGGGKCVNEFRDVVKEASKSSSERRALVVSYSRIEFQQTGDGHYSCIGGYDEAEDAVLIMDVARFKYPAHWVKLEDLYRAMQRLDPDTGKPRGYVYLEASTLNSSFVFTLRTRVDEWKVFNEFLEDVGKRLSATAPQQQMEGTNSTKKPFLCQEENCCSVPTDGQDVKEHAIQCFFRCMPEKISNSLTTFQEEFAYNYLPFRPRDHELRMEELIKEIKTLPVYSLIKGELAKMGKSNINSILACVLFLAFPEPTKFFFGTDVTYDTLRDISNCSPTLRHEVQTLRNQIELMISSAKQSKESYITCCGGNCSGGKPE